MTNNTGRQAMKRTVRLLSGDWLYCGRDRKGFAAAGHTERGFARVTLPHANEEVPVNYFSERRAQFVSWYRTHLPTPPGLGDGRVFLDFDGVMMVADVYVNGRHTCTHRGGYVGFSVDITYFLKPRPGTDNVVAVRVDSRLHADIPPCGRVMDYQAFGGIYRDVYRRVVPACHLDDLFVRTPCPLESHKTILATATVINTGAVPMEGSARLDLLTDGGRLIASGPTTPCRVPAHGKAEIAVEWPGLPGLELWDIEKPFLYRARLTVCEGRDSLDRLEARFGFREATFTKEGPFLLNGRPLKLVGHNRHQTYPYIGAAAPARLQRRDADVLKYELGANIVRTSHYPQSPHFLACCDEIGLLVFEEAPGWGFIGDAGWKDLFCRDIEAMIRRDRNHPSVILWGVRVNESGDDHDFYTRTNALARRLDPSRPTGGVRWGVKSEFLEDVFTANDYGYRPPAQVINEPPVTPYLVTEYGSLSDARHTAPCEVLVKFAVIHADILNALMGHPKVAGGIGWCAFDYASQDWISVDGIQPWGVCDIFRHPKFAAAFYASQMDPSVRPVLQAASRWKVGDQAGFDPNENTMKNGHDAPLVIFSNCDRIEVRLGGEVKGTFEPARARFPHLAHPPFLCTGLGTLWGPSWKDLHLVGYVGGRIAAEQRIPASHEAATLELTVDDRELRADGSDMTRVLLRHTDGYGNLQPHSRAVVTLKLAGPATLVGPNPCALAGGVAGLYVRAGTKVGLARLTARSDQLGPARTATVRLVRPFAVRPATGSHRRKGT